MPDEPGTYLLLLHNQARRRVVVGSRGPLVLAPGFFLYVGSAFGAGDLKSRIGRHARRHKPPRWHIDYLRAPMRYLGAWISLAGIRLEHAWAVRLATSGGLEPVDGLGASDCDCATHVFFTPDDPDASLACNLDGAPRFVAAATQGARPA